MLLNSRLGQLFIPIYSRWPLTLVWVASGKSWEYTLEKSLVNIPQYKCQRWSQQAERIRVTCETIWGKFETRLFLRDYEKNMFLCFQYCLQTLCVFASLEKHTWAGVKVNIKCVKVVFAAKMKYLSLWRHLGVFLLVMFFCFFFPPSGAEQQLLQEPLTLRVP